MDIQQYQTQNTGAVNQQATKEDTKKANMEEAITALTFGFGVFMHKLFEIDPESKYAYALMTRVTDAFPGGTEAVVSVDPSNQEELGEFIKNLCSVSNLNKIIEEVEKVQNIFSAIIPVQTNALESLRGLHMMAKIARDLITEQ